MIEGLAHRVNTANRVEHLMDLMQLLLGLELGSVQVFDNILVLCLKRLYAGTRLIQIDLLLIACLAHLTVAFVMEPLFLCCLLGVHSALL